MDNKNISILIVEDEIFASKYLSGILKNLGYKNIFEVTNAKDALKIVQNNTIDLTFMDININGPIDGIRCANILNEEYFIPIIFTTAYGDSLTIKEASNTNLFSYLVKPFEPYDVEAALSVGLKIINLHKTHNNEIILENTTHLIDLGDNQIYNLSSKTFFINEKPIELTKKELELLDFFCNNLNQNISYETLKIQVWQKQNISNSTIRDSISRLKRKAQNLNLKNIVNVGYILSN